MILLLIISTPDNSLAAAFVRIKIFPEHVGVFTTVRKQQFVAFGIKADGKAVNITKKVDWKSSNKNIVTINSNGLATVAAGRTFGQVKISCSYPKKVKKPVSLQGPYILLLRDKPAPPPPTTFLQSLFLLLLGNK